MDKSNFDTLEVCDIEIVNYQGKVIPIKDQVIALSVYESIFKSLVTCELTLLDAVALAHNLPIIGEEKLNVRIKTTNASSLSEYQFTLHGLENILSEARHQGYTLVGTSVESLADAKISVQKGYLDTYDSMIQDIFKTFLGSQKEITTTSTKGVHQIIIPNLSPLKAIDFIRQRAVSNQNSYSPYVFFETASGFHFSDIVTVFKEGKSADLESITRFYRLANNEGMTENDGAPWKNIVAYQTLSQHDTLSKTHNGAFYNNLNRFDLFKKEFKEVETKLSDVGSSFDLVDDGEFNSSDMVGEMSSSGATNYMVFVDGSRPDTHIDFLGEKVAFSTLLFQHIIEAEFHGDTSIEAGQVLYLNIDIPSGLTSSDEEDGKQTGYHMISKLAHHVTMVGEPSLRTVCELVKGTSRSIEGNL